MPFFALLCLIFSGCSNNFVQQENSEGTVRYTSEKFDSQIEWTLTIDENVLTDQIKNPEDIDRKVKISPNNIFLIPSDSECKEIYPCVSGFASLDLSLYNSVSLSFVKNFCAALIDSTSLDSFFEKNHAYTMVIFKYQLSKILPENYIFTDYLLGEPFVFDDCQECPVRLFYSVSEDAVFSEDEDGEKKSAEKKSEGNEKKSAEKKLTQGETSSQIALDKTNLNYIDVYLYIKKMDTEYKIDQISFMQKEF